MNSKFNEAFKKLIAFEGGYSNDSDDAGGETYKGISRNNYPNWKGWKLIDSLKNNVGYEETLNLHSELEEEVKIFYYENYWLQLKCDKINSSLIAQELFESAVNIGIKRAVEYLQKALNILNRNKKLYDDIIIDGIMGNITLNTLNKSITLNGEKLIYNILNFYQAFHYLRLMEFKPVYEKYIGWFKRIDIIK